MTDNLTLFWGVDKFTWRAMKTPVEVTAVFAGCHIIYTFQFVSDSVLNQTSAAHRMQSRQLLKFETAA